MNTIVKLEITRDVLEEAAASARSASTKKAKQRLLVSQAVSLTFRDHLETEYGVECFDGRAEKTDYSDLIDVNDFSVNGWAVEVRTATEADERAIYIPTVPMIVGFLSDLYVAAVVDRHLTKVDILGFADRKLVADADLTPNGLMAILPDDELFSMEKFVEIIRQKHETDEENIRLFEEWTIRAGRLSRKVEQILGSEDDLTLEDRDRLAASLRDEVLRLYGEKAPPLGVEQLMTKLKDRFNLDEAIRRHPGSPILFSNSSREEQRSSDPSTERKLLKDELPVASRVGLYRRFLESPEEHEAHKKTISLIDKTTDGGYQVSPQKRAQIRVIQDLDAEASEATPIPPPANDLEQKEIEEWFLELDPALANEKVELAEPLDPIQIMELIKPNDILVGSLFNEPVRVITTQKVGEKLKIIGNGMNTGLVLQPILSAEQIATLQITSDTPTFDGNPLKFKLGIESLRLKLAYEYDPFFALSVARVDPLPHQLEAVYNYFLKLPRIRFLLADDPGAGKTIMAGLLVKELKLRGLIKRILIITPAALSFQWQREMKDKFREDFRIIKGGDMRSQYGVNPFQDIDQVVTSVSWVSTQDYAKQSLLRSEWDLIIVDEAHKLSAYGNDKTTLAYRLGEELFPKADHLLLMTATPHKGDPENFRKFLELLDKDVYGDIESLKKAMERKEAPFYLRRTKEALETFPDPETGKSKKLFTKRNVVTIPFHIDNAEADLYNELTSYVEEQSIKASQDVNKSRGRILGFTMAMLQRRFASSIYALRRTLQRMKDKRQAILDDPQKYIEEQRRKQLPDNYEDLPDEEQQRIMADLEDFVAFFDPDDLREEIEKLGELIDMAEVLESREVETKLACLKEEITKRGIFEDPKNKLLIFTEHADTLNYLVGKLREWGLSVTQISGSMKVGDSEERGTRIFAEREFKESVQIMVATEAAGEGINLQFCWFMINYDMPWNPMRLEQRMGRIHRYGQINDCLILNFVAENTREGRVLEKLLDKLEKISDALGRDHVFDVVGELLPPNEIERQFRDMYTRNQSEDVITSRIVDQVDIEKIKKISESTLEGLAKRTLNISALTQEREKAKERRLVPEVIEDFFLSSSPVSGVQPKELAGKEKTFRIGRLPRSLQMIGERLEPKFGRLTREYKQIVFSRVQADKDPSSEWVTPGHPLFEAVREDVEEKVKKDLQKGSILYDLNTSEPYRLDVFTASIKDGLGETVHKRLFVVKTSMSGDQELREPTLFLDLALSDKGIAVPENVASASLPGKVDSEAYLLGKAMDGLLDEVQAEREKQSGMVLEHVQTSLNQLLARQNVRHMELFEKQLHGDSSEPVEANLKTVEDKINDLNNRLEKRTTEIEQERHCSIGDVTFVGSCWALPHPERQTPEIAAMVSDADVERRAVDFVIAHEQAQGRVVESVEVQNRGFDLISRLPHPEDPQTAMDVRFIEVKGRSSVGEIALTTNEYRTAVRLKHDYWLYVVFDTRSETPNLQVVRDPARLNWEPLTIVERYHVGAKAIQEAGSQ
jgi:superfamily II DNA or RNA helicase